MTFDRVILMVRMPSFQPNGGNMKHLLTFGLVLLSSPLFAQGFEISGKDCYVTTNKLIASKGLYSWRLSWLSIGGSGIHLPLKKTGPSTLSYSDDAQRLSVSVDFHRDSARLELKTPVGNSSKVAPLVFKGEVAQNISVSVFPKKGPRRQDSVSMSYSVSCSPGLTAHVRKINERDNAEMDRLGPPVEYVGRSPELSTLAPGTVLRLKRRIDITPPDSRTRLVEEQNALLSVSEHLDLYLGFRFAFASLHPKNNSYLSPTTYPAGTELKVKSIEIDELRSGGRRYHVLLENLSPEVADPITRITVEGRRGEGKVKIAQFAELLSSHFDVIL